MEGSVERKESALKYRHPYVMENSDHQYPATSSDRHQNGSSTGTVQMRNSNNNKRSTTLVPNMNGHTARNSGTPDHSSYQVYVGAAVANDAGAASSSGGDTAGDGNNTPFVRRYSRSDQCDCGNGGCGPLLANNLAYFGAAAWFIVAVNVKFLPAAPFPVIGNALPTSHILYSDEVAAVVPLLLWALHFIRRFTEVLFVHKYTRLMPYGESIGASVYYWGFGFWIGYSANIHLGKIMYYCPTLWILLPGIVLFVVGEVGNCVVHIAQRRMCLKRNRHSLLRNLANQQILPSGFLFRFVSCPNYTFEIVSWIGFALAVFTLPALLFLIASIITLVIYAHKKHKAYKELFNGEEGKELYPSNRKALIPFVF